PFSSEYQADPCALFARMPNDQGPVFYAPLLDHYVVTGYAEIEQVFLDNATYSAANAQLPLVPLVPAAQRLLLDGGHQPQPSMVSLDEPEHRRLRNPTVRAFTPRRVAAMEPRIRAMVSALLEVVDASRPFDLVSALTFPLPATMIFSFMGVP